MNGTLASASLPGSARLQRAGECILHERTFLELPIRFMFAISKESSFRQNAETSRLHACAPQTSDDAVQKLETRMM